MAKKLQTLKYKSSVKRELTVGDIKSGYATSRKGNTVKDQNYEKNKRDNIRAINEVRKMLGKRALPVNNTLWYDMVETQIGGYEDKELALKLVAVDITPYAARKMNKEIERLRVENVGNEILGNDLGEVISAWGEEYLYAMMHEKENNGYTLDRIIREQAFQAWESDQAEQLGVIHETLVEEGDPINYSAIGTKLWATDLKKTKAPRAKRAGRRKLK